VQLGATYEKSKQSTELFGKGCEAVAKYVNADPNEVVLGPSTTQLFRNLSLSLYDYITSDSEIVISKLDHEANIASWVQLAEWKKCTLKWWGASNKTNPKLEPDELRSLMSEKTKLVTCTHTSNVLGTISDIKAIAKTVHEVPGALLCVDAVAFAPHRAVDVRDLGVDFYSFSWYKVYGPHIASLYASKDAQKHLKTLGHFFKPTDTLENLLGLAAANYELTASIPNVCEYLSTVPWDEISKHEEKLQGILLEYLRSKDNIQIWGEPSADRTKRVPVISFTVKGRKSKDIVDQVESKSDYGIRYGAMYSNRLCKDILGLDEVDGVVRISLCHYNTGKLGADQYRTQFSTDEICRGRDAWVCQSLG
jgi:selenocysteine lyase/cysteine desulfurase